MFFYKWLYLYFKKMIDEYQKKYRIPSLTTDAIVLRKHKSDHYHDILLVTRGHYPEEGKLAFPGGFVEYGEHPENGCMRELKEETELEGKKIELLTVRGDPKRDPRRHIVSIFYVVEVDEDAEPKGGDDAREARFYDFKNILENEKNKIAFDHYGVMVELVEKKFKDLYSKVIDKNNFKLKGKNIKNIQLDEDVNNNIGKIIEMNLETIENLKIKDIKIDEKINLLLEKRNIFEKSRLNIEKVFHQLMNNLNLQNKYLNILINKDLDKYLKKEEIKSFNKSDNYTIFHKVKEILDKAIENVKNVAKNDIEKDSGEEVKMEQINKIKKITNEAIDEINKLTTLVVEQSYDLIRKINENDLIV